MSKSGKILAVIAAIVVLFFGATAIGRTVWNTYWHDVEKADENTSYETRKKVEDTARAYISSYNADVDIYNAYCNSDDENMRSYANSARIRAIQTANSYNEYLQKNSYVWSDNIPEDLPNSLSTDIGSEDEKQIKTE